MKSFSLTCDAIADRDQGRRIADFHLAKRRQLGPGCEFVGTPAALALQPGDIILVSATVPNWTCKEQRVTETEVLGLGDNEEFFVTVRTEDYVEAIYTDAGTPQNNSPRRSRRQSSVVSRRPHPAASAAIQFGQSGTRSCRLRVPPSDVTGFTRRGATSSVSTSTAVSLAQVPVADLDVPRFIRVVAVTTFGTFQSAEIATTIFLVGITAPAGGYSNNFKFPTAVATPAGYVGYSPATIGNVNDGSDATYNQGTSSITDGTPDGNDSGIQYNSYGAGTGKTGRPYFRGTNSGGGPQIKTFLYYTLDRTVGSPVWVLWQTIPGAAATITDYFGPELTGVDYSKFSIRALSIASGSYPLEITRTLTARNHAVAFDEKA